MCTARVTKRIWRLFRWHSYIYRRAFAAAEPVFQEQMLWKKRSVAAKKELRARERGSGRVRENRFDTVPGLVIRDGASMVATFTPPADETVSSCGRKCLVMKKRQRD